MDGWLILYDYIGGNRSLQQLSGPMPHTGKIVHRGLLFLER